MKYVGFGNRLPLSRIAFSPHHSAPAKQPLRLVGGHNIAKKATQCYAVTLSWYGWDVTRERGRGAPNGGQNVFSTEDELLLQRYHVPVYGPGVCWEVGFLVGTAPALGL